VIPPGLPGYRRYCPYTLDPRPDGRWTAPNLNRARALVAASSTRGAHVAIWTVSDNGAGEPAAPYIARALRHLGYRVDVRVISTAKVGRATREREGIQLQPIIFGPDYPSASEIFELFLACRGALTRHQFCDPRLDQAARRGEKLRLSAPQRSAAIWRHLDRELVDRAVWLPLVNQRIVDFVSRRLHNYEFSPVYHFLPAQTWLR
jgi:peptide/nickel transport system substrate-binding protein